MRFHVLACDYDRTLAVEGRIAPETIAAIGRVRAGGRRVLLVTGRNFDDLLAVCPEIAAFDLVVAENGAVLYDPHARRVEDLAPAPPPAFVEALRQAGVPCGPGRVIVASVVPHELAILETIRRLGLELHIIFNKEAVMVLPSGVSKASGLREALRRLGISRHNAVAIGDAENDHTFLAEAGFGVAVANAVPALAAAADHVTSQPNGAGVRELIDGPLARDLADFMPRLLSRTVPLGTADGGRPVSHPVFGDSLLIVGTPARRAAMAALFVEQLVAQEYVVCLLQPQGDPHGIGAQEGVIRLRSEPGAETARAADVQRLLRHRSTSVAIDLSALDAAACGEAAARFLEAVEHLRSETGAPHWLVVDCADRLFPAGGGPRGGRERIEWTGVCLLTEAPARLAPAVRDGIGRVLLAELPDAAAAWPPLPAGILSDGLQPNEVVAVSVEHGRVGAACRFHAAKRVTRVAAGA